MKLNFKHIATAVAFVAMGSAHAANILDARPGASTFTGSGTLTFSTDLLGALDTAKMSVVNYGAATSVIQKDTDGFFSLISASAPMSLLSLDTDSFQVTGVSTKGGMTLTAPVVRSVSSGGSMTVTDIRADLTTKTVYATIIGGNGVGTLTNFALWNYSTIVGKTYYDGAGTYDNTISGLTLTAGGLTTFTNSLGLLSLGKSALAGIADYGTIKSHIEATLVLDTPSIPEPSTYALMGLGLVGLAFAARRKSA